MRSLFFCLALLGAPSLATACGASSSTTADTPPADGSSHNGTYANADGAVTITNANPGAGFDFQLKLTSPEACSGVAYSGSATFTNSAKAKSAQGDAFSFAGRALTLEPATSQIGMACARVIDTGFRKK